MSQLFKARNYLQSIMTALDNVEHGRMPVKHLEDVFEDRVESIRNLIHAEYFQRKQAGEKE